MRSLKPQFIAFLLLIFYSNIGSSQIVAPDFSVFTTHQDSFHLHEDYLDQGKVVLIEFFFTTCPPCAQISPFMEDLYQSWGGGNEDVEFILITNKSFDETSDVADYCTQYGFTFPGVGVDGGALGVWNTYKNSPWGSIFGTPGFIVLSPSGSIQYDVSGTSVQSTLDSLNAAIARALGNEPAPEVKYYDKILSTHYYSGDTIENVFASFIDYPEMGDTTVGPPLNEGKFTAFSPDSIPENANFSIEMEKNDGALLDEVSTFDLFFIQRGILGLEDLDFYQTAAADINDDGRLSGSDIIDLRRVILEIEPSFPGRSGWRFYPDYIPDNTLDSLQYDHIWSFPQEWHYASQVENDGLLRFKGVKIGDVNHSWRSLEQNETAEERHQATVQLTYAFNADKNVYEFFLLNTQGPVKSFQFDLVHSPFNDLNLSSHISSNNFFFRQLNDHTIRIGFYDGYTRIFENDYVLFTIASTSLEAPEFNVTNSELFDEALNPKRIEVAESPLSGASAIYPNPANDFIGVYSEKVSKAEILNFQGQVLMEIKMSEGWNNIDVSLLHPGSYLIRKFEDNSYYRFLKL